MIVRVSAPGTKLSESQVERIHRDLDKIERRLNKQNEVYMEVRINANGNGPVSKATLNLEYGSVNLVSTGEGPDTRRAVIEAREDMLRQINDRSPKSHSDYAGR